MYKKKDQTKLGRTTVKDCQKDRAAVWCLINNIFQTLSFLNVLSIFRLDRENYLNFFLLIDAFFFLLASIELIGKIVY